jgi:hypothetical protein
MPKIDSCYNQPTGMADAGAKSSSKPDCCEPSKFKRNETTEATEEHDVKELRDKQLGSNGMQSNGFSDKVAEHSTPYPRRGFNQK